jgi:threonine-phosphate decarboxylase
VSGKALRDNLLKRHGLMVRECSNKLGSCEQYLRLAVQGQAAVDVLVPAISDELSRLTAPFDALSA